MIGGVKQLMKSNEKSNEVTPTEQDILKKVRTIGYGEVTVKVKDGRPVLVTESKTTRLD